VEFVSSLNFTALILSWAYIFVFDECVCVCVCVCVGYFWVLLLILCLAINLLRQNVNKQAAELYNTSL
jgi:hypothetical protein